MDTLQKIQLAANSFYNRGLELAKERDLSGAAGYLKRALELNKYHTDARNLLGLIFYEMGETSDALVQWVISVNLQPEENRADHYLDEVQRKPGQLEIASQTIKKFNQALVYAQNGSDDLAVLQLKRVVEERPNYVKARLLLAVRQQRHGDQVIVEQQAAGKAVAFFQLHAQAAVDRPVALEFPHLHLALVGGDIAEHARTPPTQKLKMGRQAGRVPGLPTLLSYTISPDFTILPPARRGYFPKNLQSPHTCLSSSSMRQNR